MCFIAPQCHHRIFSEQLFQLRFTGVLLLNFHANLFSSVKLKQLFRKYYDTICPTAKQLFAIQSDMSRQRLLVHRRSAATGLSLYYDTICPAAGNSFTLQYELSS